MNITSPDLPGLSSAFLLGQRRRPGSGVGSGNTEEVIAIILKRAYTIEPSDSDPALGRLVPRADGPEIFEADQPGGFLSNGNFADGLNGWLETGGARAAIGDKSVAVLREGSVGDLRRNASFGRTLRDREIGFFVKAQADTGLGLPTVSLSASGEPHSADDPGGVFPAPDKQPVLISGVAQFSGAVSSSTLSIRLGTMPGDGDSVTFREASLSGVVYESDLVPFKPEADLIVIADQDPVPLSVAVNGTVRMSQEAFAARPLTGLGWAARTQNPRKAEAGDFGSPPSPSQPDDFQNSFFNGYRRDRRQGGPVPYLQDGDAVGLIDNDGDLYGFTLTTGTPRGTHSWFVGEGEDNQCWWREREVDFVLDTLVIERDRNQAYAVWRSVWPAAFVPPGGGGPVPVADNRGVAIRWEGS